MFVLLWIVILITVLTYAIRGNVLYGGVGAFDYLVHFRLRGTA